VILYPDEGAILSIRVIPTAGLSLIVGQLKEERYGKEIETGKSARCSRAHP
jgi:hypothetical protein